MRSYESRAKELVEWRTTTVNLDKSITPPSPPYYASRQWVYTRADGSQFVNLRAEYPVLRDGEQAYVEHRCTEARAFSAAEWLRGVAGGTGA